MTTKAQPKAKIQGRKSVARAKRAKARPAASTCRKKLAHPKMPPNKPKTKLAIIRELVERPDGASIAELTKVTKWQAHSVRAALAGLRKTGADIVRTKDDGDVSRYQIGRGQ